MQNDSAPTKRFSNTVEYYVKYRPSYPLDVINLLKEQCQLNENSVIADIGSGTGIFAKLLLENHFQVFAIEPNDEMRHESEQGCANFAKFISVNATAETTGLPDQSVDGITAATSFHWFIKDKARAEFKRILKPQGWCLLVWNLRIFENSPFMQGYEALLNQYGINYHNVAAEKIDENDIVEFFRPSKVNIVAFPNKQVFDWEGLQGRLMSTSYTPKPGHEDYEPMMSAARKLFDKHQQNNAVDFLYQTKCFWGHLD